MKPGAFLALWNSVDAPAWVDEYEAWHAFEHVPERVGSPGFMAGARYAVRPGTATGPEHPAYFTCYWLEDLAALRTPQYQALLDHPSEWSRRMRAHLSDFRRQPCTLGGRHGQGMGAQLATLEVPLGEADDGTALHNALGALVDTGAALAAHWGRITPDGGHPLGPTTAQPAATERAVVLLEQLGAPQLDRALGLAVDRLAALGLRTERCARYALHSQVRPADLGAPLTQRQPEKRHLSAWYRQHNSGDNA